MAFYTIKSLFHSIHSLTEVALNIKKAAFVISSVVSVDHITKSLIELSPDSVFEYLDSLLSFYNSTELNTPEL